MGVATGLNVEESLKLLENVGKQIDCHDLVLDLSWQSIKVLVISIQACQPVLRPVVAKVGLDLCRERLWQRLTVCESRQQDQPVVQITALVDDAHLFLVVADDFDEVAHNIGKEGYATKHDQDGDDSFVVGDGVVVTIPHCTERGQCIVATDYQLVCLVLA